MEEIANRDSDLNSDQDEGVRSGRLQCAARTPSNGPSNATSRCQNAAIMKYRGIAGYCDQHKDRVRER